MATTTGNMTVYDNFILELTQASHNWTSNTNADVRTLLTASTYTPVEATHNGVSDVTNELAGNGYARHDHATVTGGLAGGNVDLDLEDAVFGPATGGSIVARWYVVYNDSTTTTTHGVTDALVCYGNLDATPANVTATSGNTITIQWNANGVIRLS